MTGSKTDQFVWAYFDNFNFANDAARQIEKWDKALVDVELGSIGVIHMTDKGKVKTHTYGSRSTRKGVKIGMILGVLAALLPAVTLVGGLATGAVVGGVAGRLSKRKLGLTEADIERVKAELESGKAMLIVTCDDSEVEGTEIELANLGGKIEAHTLSSQELEESAQELSGSTSEEISGP